MVTIECARCHERKHATAYAVFAKTRDRAANNRVLSVERDTVCRRCRSEMHRGVPDDVVRWRNREIALERQLAKVRAKIRSLTAVRGPQEVA